MPIDGSTAAAPPQAPRHSSERQPLMDALRRSPATAGSAAAGRAGDVNNARSTHGPHLREAKGVPETGHIVRLCTGQCYGTIRTADGRDVWFHRSDMSDRASFNKFVVGDSVKFELVPDRISGARALSVQRNCPGPDPSAV
jgi:cold shock CspA family protein